MEEKIFYMQGKDMTTAETGSQMEGLYSMNIANGTTSYTTEKLLTIVKEWNERPLEEIYALVSIDVDNYYVRNQGKTVKRWVYKLLGTDMNGKKDVLGIYIGGNRSLNFFYSIMSVLKKRGVEDILIVCVYGLKDFSHVIKRVYPQVEIQQYINYQIRNSTKFISKKNIKKVMEDLKLVYGATTEEIALNELELFKEKWEYKYPQIYKMWRDNWATLLSYFRYPENIRRIIYTTNEIDELNFYTCKMIDNKTIFPSDDSLLKIYYIIIRGIGKKWTKPRKDWFEIHSQLQIYFRDRLLDRNL